MKKVLFLFLSSVVLVSCGKNVEFNNPAMQARVNNSFWKASNISATKNESGSLTLTGYSGVGNLILTTSAISQGTYILGSTNQVNNVSYTSVEGVAFTAAITQSPVNKVTLSNGGSGYVEANSVSTTATSGLGSGLKLNIKANASGVITEVEVSASGNGYKAGDIVSVTAGNNNAVVVIQNVTKSNGEVTITESDGATISGTFKFVAFDAETGATAVCRDGIFYKVPIN